MPSRSTLIKGILLAVGLLGTVMIAYATIPTPIVLPTAMFRAISLPTFTHPPTVTPSATPTPIPTRTAIPPTPTPTPVRVSAPSISPDGKLAYVEAGRLMVVGQDDSTAVAANLK